MYKSLRLFLILMLGFHFSSFAQTVTFPFTGTPQSYVVPAGVTAVSVTVTGAVGGLNNDEVTYPDRRGYGACVNAIIVVTPGQILNINVGGHGGDAGASTGGTGGYNGGGAGSVGLGAFAGGGGGGASDVSDALGIKLVMAGGGGGAGENCTTGNTDRGGDGGGTVGTPFTGETGAACGATVTGGQGGFMFTGLPGTAAGGVCSGCPGSPGGNSSSYTGGAGGSGSAGGGGGGGYGGGGGGQWSGGGGGGDYAGGPNVYFVSETRGCNTTSDGSVAITPYCVHGTISGPDSICNNSSALYTETVTGGTWSSFNTSVAIVGTDGTVTGVGPGVDTIYYTLISSTPVCQAKMVITVNPTPADITGPAAFVCQGSTLTLTETSTGGVWSSSVTAAGTVGTSGIVTGISPGSTTISYTFPTGCAATYPVIVDPVPSPIAGPSAVCSLSSIVLTDPDGGGTWNVTPITGTASIVAAATVATVTGTSAGTVTVSYTVGSCAATTVVTVNALPALIGGGSSVCIGSTITATDGTGGGTWSSGTPAVATIGSTSGIITPVATGTTSICFTVTSTGCQRCETVTVNPLPAAIAGTFVVCQGNSASVSDASGTGLWTIAPTTVATITAGPSTAATWTGLSSGSGGTATITFTLSSTGCSVTHGVTVNPTPTITGPSSACVGAVITYTASPTPGTWTVVSGGTAGSIVSATGVFTAGPGTGNVTIRYTVTATTCSVTKVITVNPNPAAIAGPATVCIGGPSITLSDATTGGTWSSPDDPTLITGVAGVTTNTVSVTGAGTSSGVASVTYTLPTSCLATYTVSVYPNPAAISGTVTQMCQGDTTYLTDATPGGAWTSSLPTVASIGTSGQVIGVGTTGGVVTFTYTMPSGCYVTYDINVFARPTTPFTPVPFSMCISDPPLSISTSGGTGVWSSQNTSVATVVTGGVTTTGTVTAISPGVDSICYQFTSGPGCHSCQQFTVNPVPVAITGPSTVCTGQTIALTDLTGSGTWTASNGHASVNAITGVVTGNTAGVDTIYYTVGTGCRVSHVVTVNQSPAAISFTTLNICQGQTLNLSDATTPPPGTWSSTPITVATVSPTVSSSTVVTGVGAGVATISYTVANGCAATVQVTVTTLSSGITGASSVCTGSTITLSESTPTGGTWTVSPAAGVASVTAGPSLTTTVTGVGPGTATITYSYLGCQASKTITVNQTPTALITPLGSTDLCPGNVVALTATTGVGYTYVWRDPGVIPGATGPTYTTGTAGTYSVTVSTAFCSATSPGVTITVNPVTAGISVLGSLTTCASTPPTLTATPAGMSYQWEDASGPMTGVVSATFTPTVSGSYDVIVTNSFGCTGTSPVDIVTLIPSPDATITLSGPLNFCAGDSVVMTTVAAAGNTYQWYTGGLPIAGATNVSYTARLTGTYTVQVSNSIGCTTTSVASVVTVTPGPVATILVGGSTVFCAGSAVVLSAPGGAGLTYQWYTGGVPITGATNAVYTASATGNYTVQVTSTATGCSTMSAATSLTEVALPLIQPLSATVFCWGGSVTLAATLVPGAGSVTYQWQRNGINIPGKIYASDTVTTSGNYSVIVTVLGATPVCTVTSTATTVTEHPLPNPLVTYDGTYFHTGTFVSYQWYKNTLAIAGATTSMTHNLGAGTYKVIVTDTNGCQSASANYILGATGVPNVNANGDIKIYPNPAQAMVHIESGITLHAFIYSMDGRAVIDQADAKDINIAGLADGVYIIKLYDENGIMMKTEKLVKATN